jgi:hypothetical protein
MFDIAETGNHFFCYNIDMFMCCQLLRYIAKLFFGKANHRFRVCLKTRIQKVKSEISK